MYNLKKLKDNLSQILALTEKNLKLQTRFKFHIIFRVINPIIALMIPLVLMGTLFRFNSQFGPWTVENFIVYQFIAYQILLLRRLTAVFSEQFRTEKYWKTLPALIVGPFTRFNLLFGIFFSHIVMIAIPFTMVFTINLIFFPIDFLTILFMLLEYLLIALIMSGIGLMLGIFAISFENLYPVLGFLLNFVFLFSCVSFPYQIFPTFIQNIINLNPLYYIFDLLRLTWIENNIFITLTTHQFNFYILVSSAIILPFVGVYVFNITYKKFGITGY